jgi:putative transposase
VTRRKRRPTARRAPPLASWQPNDLWCADYKGEFMLADRRYCYPLTITDFASRYLITCDALATTQGDVRVHRLRAHFQEFGLPRAMRTDNGVRSPAATRSTA